MKVGQVGLGPLPRPDGSGRAPRRKVEAAVIETAAEDYPDVMAVQTAARARLDSGQTRRPAEREVILEALRERAGLTEEDMTAARRRLGG